VIAAFAEHAVAPDDVAEIELVMSDTVAHDVLMYGWPRDPTEGRFSLAFNVAAAWADGRVGVDTFTEEKIVALEPLRERIRVRGMDGRPPVVVHLRMVDGRELTTLERTDCQGPSLGDDPSAEDPVRAKFRASVAPRWGRERARALLAQLDTLESLTALGELTELLR
jgi:2-methylcitrate dehydratase PrpD